MKKLTTIPIANKTDELQIINDDVPCIFLVIPFESKMNKKSEFDIIVNTAARKAEKKLLQNYPASEAEPVTKKLHRVIQEMAYKPNHKSVAIMVSPLVEKIYYFDYTPERLNRYEKS